MFQKVRKIQIQKFKTLPDSCKRVACLPVFIATLISVFISLDVVAHHVLGRPSYSLGEDSTTPPSMQIETQIGDYFVNFAVFPAFPKPGVAGRLNLYAVNMISNQPPNTDIEFKVRDDSWFSLNEEILGTQKIDDGVYRQGFVFQKKGAYIISANFHDGKAPYTIDFPIRIGRQPVIGPIGITIGIIAIILISVNLIQRKRIRRRKPKNSKVSAE